MATEMMLYLLGAFVAGVVIAILFFRGQRAPAIKAATAESRSETTLVKDRLDRQKKVTEEVIREKIRLAALVEKLTVDLRKETGARAAAEATSSRIEELNATILERDDSMTILRELVSTHEQQKAALETTVKKERQAAAEKLAMLEKAHDKLAETFKSLSSEALKSNNEQFLEIATSTFEKFHGDAKSDLEAREKAVAEIVAPVQETLAKVDSKIQNIEDARISAYGTLTEQIKSLGSTQDNLRNETSKLASALRTPIARGSWGEVQLRRIVEIAGMQDHCDFFEQGVVDAGDDSPHPDMIVRLPGGRSVVVDAKTPLCAYMDAIESDDDEQTRAKLAEHARLVREKITALTKDAYLSQFQPEPEFVVLFLPGEMFFSAALQEDASLIEHGASQRVILAAPTTLIALLKAVAYGWREEHLAENARAISDLGQELYARISTLAGHWGRVGHNLGATVDAYNKALASLENRVLVSARRFKELEAAPNADDIATFDLLERAPRTLQAPELVQPTKSGANDDVESA